MPTITPFLWFTGQAEEAARFYVSVFKQSRITNVTHYAEGGPGPAGTVMTVEFELDGQALMAINAPSNGDTVEPDAFAQGKVALFLSCPTQAEVDELWTKLTADGGREMPCGWVIDRYGFAWNIIPEGLGAILGGDDPERAQRAMQTMLGMRKLDIGELRRAYGA
jgi:predicted 3-demethylubiquinone-9 3-methyltransferase (glyoxalase superfamily)